MDIKLGTTFTLFQAGRKRLNPSYFLCVFRDVDANEIRQAITQSIGDAVGPLLLELTEGTSDPLNGVVQLYQGDWILTVYEQVSATNLDAANANRTVWSELVRVSAQCDADPGPQPYDPCTGCGGETCDLCTEIAKNTSTAQAIVECIDDAGKTEAVQALICDPCDPTTVNGVESDTPTITVLQGGNPVGTLNPATGVVTIDSCPIEVEVLNTDGDLVDSASIPDPCEQEGPVVLTAPDGSILWDGITFTQVVSGGKIDIDCDTPIPAAYVLDGGSKTGTYKVDGAVNGKPRYRLDANHTLEYSGTRWECIHPGPDDQAAAGNEDFPWLADWIGTSLTVTQATIAQYCDDCPECDPLTVTVNGLEGPTVNEPCGETVALTVEDSEGDPVTVTVDPLTGVITVPALPCAPCDPVTVRTTDGLTTIATPASGANYDVPQSRIKYRDAANAPQKLAASDTEFDATNLLPATEIPRRELFNDTPAPLGLYVTLDDLVNDTVPQVPAGSGCTRAISAAWAAGDADTLGIILPAEYQGITYDFVSEAGSNGTITISINNGGSFASPPFTVGAAEVIFRRTTTTNAGSALYEE